MERRETKYFAVERLINTGRELQFYEHMEICCIEKGTAFVVVSGESEYLSEGQIVIIDPFENYSIEQLGEVSILILSIGTSYLRYFFSLYPGKKLPRWLMDSQFNRGIYDVIQKCSEEAVGEQNELRMTGIVCDLLYDLIEHYGMEEKKHDSADDVELVAKIVKYIHENCSETITLDTLSKEFYMSPTVLSKKLRKRLGVDLRVFVNDIRAQKAARMMEDSQYNNKTIYEIAMMCGFSSMSTFYRCYKRNFCGEIPQKDKTIRE